MLYGIGLWGSIKLLDHYNTRNSLAMALAVGLLFALIVPWLGLLFSVLPLMGLLFLLVFYYQLGYLHAFLVIVLQAVILYIAGELLRGVIGEFGEETAVAWLLVVAFLLFLVFYVRRDLARRKSGVRDRRDEAPIPPARAKWLRKRGEKEPQPDAAEPLPPSSSPPPPPSPAAQPQPPSAAAPPRSQQPATPPSPPAPRDETRPLPEAGDDPDEPRFLR